MQNSKIILCFCLLLLLHPVSHSWRLEDPEVQRLQQEINRRTEILVSRSTNETSVRGAMKNAAELGLFSEQVIFSKAREKKLTVTDTEINTFILPMLAQQGLVDLACPDVFKDENVRLWLTGQGMNVGDLKQSAEALALWAKIATESVVAQEDSVKLFVQANPGMGHTSDRVRITLLSYIAPPGTNTRSVLPGEVIAPCFALQTRSAAAELEAPLPASWANLKLYLELDKIDVELREVLGGKQPGYRFGPMLLSNGATLEGTLDEYLPATDLTESAGFWQMAAIRYRLQKADQEKVFNGLVEEFWVTCKSPAVRGFWKNIWGGVKRGFSFITGAAGGLIGYFAGGPKGAMMGAKYGYQLGNSIKGWFSTKSVLAPKWSMGYGGSPQPIPAEYLSGSNFNIPAEYYRRPSYPSYQQQNYYLPAMPPGYRQQPQYREFPPQEVWAPQLFFGSPIGYYY